MGGRCCTSKVGCELQEMGTIQHSDKSIENSGPVWYSSGLPISAGFGGRCTFGVCYKVKALKSGNNSILVVTLELRKRIKMFDGLDA